MDCNFSSNRWFHWNGNFFKENLQPPNSSIKKTCYFMLDCWHIKRQRHWLVSLDNGSFILKYNLWFYGFINFYILLWICGSESFSIQFALLYESKGKGILIYYIFILKNLKTSNYCNSLEGQANIPGIL